MEGVLDSAATSTVGAPGDEEEMKSTGQKSHKRFLEATGNAVQATEIREIDWNIRGEAANAHMVPGAHSTLVSLCKFTDAGYVIMLHKDGAEIYDGEKTIIKVMQKAILRAYQCRKTGLWRISLRSKVENKNMDTVLWNRINPEEAVSHVFELPSTKETICYLHAAAGFPQRDTWIKAIRKGSYAMWPGLTVTAVNKFFPEADETQQGHMKGVRQGLRLTKETQSQDKDKDPAPVTKQNDIMIKTVDLKETIYTDQTEKFLYVSSKGNCYIMVAVHVDANAIYVEPMKNRTQEQFVETYERLVTRMRDDGLSIKKQVLDNEASAEYKRSIRQKAIE